MTPSSITKLLDSHASFLLGHRGARGEAFENSLIGFEYTHQLSKQSQGHLVGIEFDVQLTRDGQLAVFHDDFLLRLFGHQTRVDQSSYAEIQRLSAGKYQIKLLEDILPFLEGYQHIELEIKTHNRTNHAALIAALHSTLKQPVFEHIPFTLTSFDVLLHERMQAHPFLSTFKRGLLVEPSPRYLHAHLKDNSTKHTFTLTLDTLTSTAQPLCDTPYIAARLGCSSVGLYHPFYSAEMMQLLQRFDLSTTAWTVNTTAEAKRLIELGVRYIITDHPTMMLQC